MKQRLLKKILVLLFTVILTFSVFFGFISSNVNADPLPAIDGTHNFGSYFNYNGSNSAISTDTNFTIETDKYTFMSDGTGAWIDDLNKVEEEIVTITVGKNDGGSLQSFILNSVDVGEYLADGVYTVTIKGYIGTKEVFSTEPYHNVQTGEENHFPLDMSNAQGKVIDNFKIIYTKGAGTGFAHENFTLYSFTINSASTDPPPETTAPNVTSITRLNPVNEATNAETVTYCIAFDETVSGVDINDFALTTTGTATGTIASVSTDSGATRDVTVNNISGNGTLRLDLKNNGTGIIDTAGNAISGGFTLGEIYTVDTISPSVSSIARLTPVDELTNATSVTYRVTFNEVVSGVDIADFTLINTGTAIGSISSASAVGDQIIDVTVDIISGNGTLRLDLKDNGTGIVDGVGNTISGGFTGGQFYTIDTNAPTVSSIVRQTPIDEITNAATVTYRVTFSEAVSGVDTTDFVLTGTATGTIASVSADSGTTMNVIVNDISGIGTLRLDLKDSGTGIVDGIGNAISGGFTSGESYTIDTVAPRVVSIIRQMPADELTNAASVIYRVSFSKAVSGVDTTDFVLTTTGTATGTIASVSTDSGATRDVTVNNISGNGTLRLDLKNNGTGIIDTAGNAISGGFNTGQTYSIDTEAPSVSSIIRLTPRCELTNATSVTYRVTFNEVVSGVDIADFTLINTGTAIGTIASVSASSGIAIDVTVDTISGTGKLRLDLNSSGTGIVDGLGNAISGGYTTGETYTVDTVAPTISSATEVAVNNAYIDVTFSEEVRGANDSTTLVEPSDFGVNFLTNGGTATGATITSITKTTGGDIDGSEKTVRFNLNITGIPNGVETIEIKPASETSIYDIAGNSMLSTQTCGTKNLNPVTVAVTSITVKGEGDVTTIDTKAGTLQMIAEVLPTDATDKSVTWAVTEINGSATTKATIDTSGLLTAVKNGIVRVTATSVSEDVYGTKDITITNNPIVVPVIPVTSITVTGEGNATLIDTPKGTLQMIAEVLPTDATDKSVTWAVTEINGAATTKATIDTSGLLTAVKNGIVRVTATSVSEDVYGTKDITITNNPDSKPDPKPNSSPSTPKQDNSFSIIVNGKVESAATLVTTTVGGKTVTTVTLDDKKIQRGLEAEGNNSIITIPIKRNSDVVVVQLNGTTAKNMESKETVLEIKAGNVTYTLPVSEININDVSSQIGDQIKLKDIKVNIKIAACSQDTVKFVKDTAKKNGYQMVVRPVDFDITCTNGAKTIDVSKFNGYVERAIAIPDGINPTKITTGVVLNNDGTFSHVPTAIIVVDDKYYAKINSLTNSTYLVIWNELSFRDMEGHWAKDDVNDLGSRLVINGVSKEAFSPNKYITRAEFASVIVKALGLMRPGTGKEVFSDVTSSAWYFDAVSIAYERGIVKGYNRTFKPMDKITREEAMTMLSKAMEIAKLENKLSADVQNTLLAKFNDGKQVSTWAKESVAACLDSKIAIGTNNNILPHQNITRAETAVLIRRMLKTAKLI